MTAKVNTDKNIVESAKIVACKIADKEIRKRTYALNIAANAAAKYFEADTKQSLYKVPSLSANLEIADIYVNGVRYDVRVTFDGKTFCIPKVHQKYEAVPAAYIVVQFGSALKEVEILGFVPSADLDYEKTNSEYFCYQTDILKPLDEFQAFDSKQSVKIHPYSTLDHDRIKELCSGFIDDQITETEKIYFIKHVIACPVCRDTFCDMNDFDTILSQLKNYEELLSDSTLAVFAGNKEEFDQALIAGLSVVENESDGILESDIPMLNLLEFTDTEEDSKSEDAEDSDEEIAEEIEENALEETVVEETVEAEAGIEAIDAVEAVEAVEELGELEDCAELDSLDELETLDEQVEEESIVEAPVVEEPVDLETVIEEDNSDSVDLELQEQDTLLEELVPAEEMIISDDELILEEQIVEDTTGDNLINGKESERVESVEEVEELQEISEDPVVLEEEVVPPAALEEISPVEDDVQISEVDTLELGDLDTLDTLDSLEPLEEIEAIDEEPVDAVIEAEAEEDAEQEEEILEESVPDEIKEETEIETIEDIEELEDVEEIEEPVFYQEPVELNYDEDEEQVNEAETANENYNENVLTDEIEPVESVEEPVQNDEIQSLLDDDLLALLSDDEPASSDMDSEPVQKEFVPQIEGAVFAAEHEETPDVSESDDTIHTLFENQNEDGSESDEENAFELAPEPVSASTINKTKQLAVAAVLVLLLAGGGIGAWFMNHQKASVEENSLDTANSDNLFDFQNQGSKSAGGENGQDTQSAAVSQDINRSMANSFSDKPAAISITKISWQVSEKLASEASVKEYLQTAGKNIQMNLQNDLANASDVAFNNSVKVALEIAPDNTMKGAQVLTSSGSDKIDDIILRSIKNTLKYVNVPKLKDFKSDYFLTLIINF